jgi:hypothetical protein
VKRNTTIPPAGIDIVALEFGGDGVMTRLVFDEITLASSYSDLTAGTPAATVARESFNYPLTSLGGLGTASHGFGGPWYTDASDNGVEGLVSVSGTRFRYTDLSYTIPHDTMHLQWIKSNAWSDHQRYKRPLAAAWPNTAGKTYWLSYLVDFRDSLPVGNTYFMVKLFSGSTELFAAGKGGGGNTPPTWTCGSGWPGSSGDDVSTTQLTGDPTWVVVRVNMSGNGTDPCRTYMWIDPNPAVQPDTTSAIVKRNTTIPPAGIDIVALEFGGDGVMTRLVFDEIHLATTYAGLTATAVHTAGNVPLQFALTQNYPNPFNPSTHISFTLARSEQVRLSVHNVLGQEVAVLVNGVQSAGAHEVTFHAEGLSSGIYFYRLQSAQGTASMKMLLLR